VWRQASVIDEEQMRRALAGAGRQAQPWGIVSALQRRRWLRPAKPAPGRPVPEDEGGFEAPAA